MARQPVSLDAPVGDDGDVSVGDFIEDKRAESPSAGTSKSMLKEKLEHVLGLLSTRERTILEMRFGLVDGYGHTLEEIGNLYSVTRECEGDQGPRCSGPLFHAEVIRIQTERPTRHPAGLADTYHPSLASLRPHTFELSCAY